jgi:predicted transposase YdaD
MKILAADDLSAVLSIVGVHGRAEPLNVELPASSTKADLVARTPDGIVHVEFVKDPTPNFDQRMVDYRLRLRRRDRHTALSQYVLVLRDVPVPDHYTDPGPDLHSCTWTVVHLHRLDPDALLTSPPTTAAVAVLARGTPTQRAAILTAAADLITARTDSDRRTLLLGAAATLASIVLPRATITTVLEEAAMPVPVRDTPLGRELYEEGVQAGMQVCRQVCRQVSIKQSCA